MEFTAPGGRGSAASRARAASSECSGFIRAARRRAAGREGAASERNGRQLQVEDVESVRNRGRDPGEFGDARAGPCDSLARCEPGGRPKKIRCAVSFPPSSARSAEGRSSTSVAIPRLDEEGRSLAREVRRGRRAAVRTVRALAACRPDDERAGAGPRYSSRALRSAAAVTRRSPGLRHGITVSARLGRSRRRDRDEERELEAARQPFADCDAIPGDVADAFGVRAIAMRRQSQDLAVAAAAGAGVAHKVAGLRADGLAPALRRSRMAVGPRNPAESRSKRVWKSQPAAACHGPRIA